MALTKVTNSMIQGAIVNVLDFGAVGDGVADDTIAIQAAVNSVTEGTIYFPNGTYRITGSILIDASVKYSLNLQGTGLASKILYDGTTSSIPMIYYYKGSNSAFATVENLQFYNNYRTGDTVLNGIVAIRIGEKNALAVSGVNGTCNMTIRKCQIQYCDIGIEIYSESDQTTIEDNYFFVWTGYAVWCGKNPSVVSGTGSASVRVQKNLMIGGQNGSWAVKIKGEACSVVDNVIQNATSGDGIWIFESKNFRISTNYTESTGGDNFIYVEDGGLGYIGENTIGSYPGANIIEIDATSYGINIGPNWYATSGGFPAFLILIDPAATSINILGEQKQTVVGGGGISGPVNFIIGATGNTTVLQTLKAAKVNTDLSFINVPGASTSTLFTVVGKSAYFVSITQGTELYSETAIVTVPENATTAIVTSLYQTNANLALSASGLNIRATNGVGATRTVHFAYLRIL